MYKPEPGVTCMENNFNTIDHDAMTVDDFCTRHSISRALFYKLIKEGKGPRIMKVGRKTLITTQSAAAWRRQMETATEA